jgi:hypothetical protein
MDELERKLRSALTEMAEEVAPSHHPWAEHQRRISARKSRRPFLMAAVAAAVVALIAVPVMVLQLRSDSVQVADVPPETPTPPRTSEATPPSPGVVTPPQGIYRPQAGETVLTQPVIVVYDTPDSKTMAYTTELNGKRNLCLVQVKSQEATPVITGAAASSCSSLSPPRSGKYVWTSLLVPSTGQGGQMLYVASEPTDHVLVRKKDGTYGKAYRIAQGTDFSLFAVHLGTNSPPAAYTARDKANVALENG